MPSANGLSLAATAVRHGVMTIIIMTSVYYVNYSVLKNRNVMNHGLKPWLEDMGCDTFFSFSF